jgi:hypothetical protein
MKYIALEGFWWDFMIRFDKIVNTYINLIEFSTTYWSQNRKERKLSELLHTYCILEEITERNPKLHRYKKFPSMEQTKLPYESSVPHYHPWLVGGFLGSVRHSEPGWMLVFWCGPRSNTNIDAIEVLNDTIGTMLHIARNWRRFSVDIIGSNMRIY